MIHDDPLIVATLPEQVHTKTIFCGCVFCPNEYVKTCNGLHVAGHQIQLQMF